MFVLMPEMKFTLVEILINYLKIAILSIQSKVAIVFQYGIFKLWLGFFCLFVFSGLVFFSPFFQFVFRSSLDLGSCQYVYFR